VAEIVVGLLLAGSWRLLPARYWRDGRLRHKWALSSKRSINGLNAVYPSFSRAHINTSPRVREVFFISFTFSHIFPWRL